MNGRGALRAGYALAIGGAAAALVVLIVGASTIAALGHEVPKELWALGAALTGAIVGVLVPSPRTTSKSEAPSPLAAAEETARAANKAAQVEAKNHPCAPAAAEAARNVELAGERAVRDSAAVIGASDQVSPGAAMAAAARVVAALQDEHLVAKQTAQAARQAAAHAEASATPGVDDQAAAKAAAYADNERAQAALIVHEKAQEAAATAAGPAATAEHETPLGLKAIVTQPKIIVPLLLFVVALALALLLGLGVIHTGVKVCKLKSGTIHSCVYYAKVTHQIATVLISIASAAAGALIGIFAKSPAEASEQAGATK